MVLRVRTPKLHKEGENSHALALECTAFYLDPLSEILPLPSCCILMIRGVSRILKRKLGGGGESYILRLHSKIVRIAFVQFI